MKIFLKDSFKRAFPGFLALSMTVVFFFFIFRIDEFGVWAGKLVKILTPFLYGGVMAYLLKTPYNFIKKKIQDLLPQKRQGLASGISVITVLLLAFAVIYLLLAMVIPALVQSIISIANQVPDILDSLEDIIKKLTDENGFITNYIDRGLEMLERNGTEWMKEHLLPNLEGMMGGLASTVGTFIGVMYNLLLGIIICIYVLLSKETFARQGKMIIKAVFEKKTAKLIIDEFVFIDRTFVGFFGGKIVDSAIIGVICYIFCLILQMTLGLSNAVLIAVIIGVTNIIPYFGPYIGAVPATILVLMDSPMGAVIFVAFVILLQLFDGNVLGPMLLSGSVGLSGFWVLFSITLFGGFYGFIGILVGVPVFAVIYDLIRRWVHLGLRKNNAAEYLPPAKPEPEEGDEGKEEKREKKKAGD